MALTIKIRADASHFKQTIAGVEVQAGGLTGVMGKLGGVIGKAGFAAALTAAAAGAVALGAGLAFIKDASGKAAGIEALTMQFETLLGTAERARERMEEIKVFAASTPFEIANLSETSKLLQTLGGDMLATGAGLRMVGDAAAIAGQPIQEVGLHFGRLFNAITSGTTAGESVSRLQELGLMTGKVKLQFEALAAAQKRGEKPILTQTQAMTLLQGVFAKTEGAMERLSTTTEGMKSNFVDAADNIKVAFGTGFNEGLKSALTAVNNFLPQLEDKFASAGGMLGIAIKDSVEGNHEMLAAVGAVIGEALMAGIRATVKIGVGSLLRDGIGAYMGLGGHLTNDPTMKLTGSVVSGAINNALGPRTGMAETIQSELSGGGLKHAVQAVEDLAILSRGAPIPQGFYSDSIELQKEQARYLKLLSEKESKGGLHSTSR
jgi:hypothetical protein